VKPVLQALVLADRVYQDVTGKKIIAGTFNTWSFGRRSPVVDIQQPNGTTKKGLLGGTVAGSPYAYISLTDVCEGTKILVQFVNLSKNQVLFGTEGIITSVKRLMPIELIFPLPALPITEAGTYAFEIVCEGEILGSWRVMAIDLDQKEKG
jgi:hypothetical protein